MRVISIQFFFFNDTATTEIYTLSLHDALPICLRGELSRSLYARAGEPKKLVLYPGDGHSIVRHRSQMLERLHGWSKSLLRSEEHTSELQSRQYIVCRLLLEKKKNLNSKRIYYT